MARSLYKGPYVDEKLLKKIAGKKPAEVGVIKTWARNSQISPEMVGFTFGVHNGKDHIEVFVSEDFIVGIRSPLVSFSQVFLVFIEILYQSFSEIVRRINDVLSVARNLEIISVLQPL